MFRHLPLAIPVAITGALIAGALSEPAQAGRNPMAPTEALSILVQARTMDSRCGFLKASAHDELADYAARAEIVTAERMGAKAAETAVNRGTKAGRSAACDSDGKGFVQDALTAAREAMRQARRPAPARRGAVHRTTSRPTQERKVRLHPGREAMKERAVALIDRKRTANFGPIASITNTRREARPVVIISAGKEVSRRPKTRKQWPIERYVTLTAEYYRQLRCGTTDRKALLRLYEKVRRAHYALLRASGPKATARAKARAKALAASRSCAVRIVRR